MKRLMRTIKGRPLYIFWVVALVLGFHELGRMGWERLPIKPKKFHVLHHHFAAGKYLQIGHWSFLNHQAYAAKYNYSFGLPSGAGSYIHFVEPASWGKLVLAMDLFKSDDPPDYILWIDADAIITNFNLSISDVLSTIGGENYDFIVAADRSPETLNCGIFILRNTAWTLNFMERILAASKDQQTRTHGLWEQNAVLQIFQQNAYDEKQHILIAKPRHFLNAFSKFQEWRWGDWIVHNTACPGWQGLPGTVEGCVDLLRSYFCAFTPVDDPSCTAAGGIPPQLKVLFTSITENAASFIHNKPIDDSLRLEQLEEVERRMGNVGGLSDEVNFLIKYAQKPGVKTICEIGFAAGHSSSAMLWANPTATLHSFDDESLGWAHEQLRYVNKSFHGRVRRYAGDSTNTVPAFQGHCDLMFVDGRHDGNGPKIDFENSITKMASGSYLLADDVNVLSFPDVVTAWSSLKTGNLIEEIECFTHPIQIFGYWKGWCAGKVL